MKYSKEFKLECVMKYINGEYIKDPPGVKHNSFRRQVKRWVYIYDSIGEIGLENYKPTLTFDERLLLITRVESGESYTCVANSVGLQESQLIKWHKIYRQEGIDSLKSLKRGRQKMKKESKPTKSLDQMTPEEKVKYYEERIEYLEAENAYLKKLRALVQRKQDLQREKE